MSSIITSFSSLFINISVLKEIVLFPLIVFPSFIVRR